MKMIDQQQGGQQLMPYQERERQYPHRQGHDQRLKSIGGGQGKGRADVAEVMGRR